VGACGLSIRHILLELGAFRAVWGECGRWKRERKCGMSATIVVGLGLLAPTTQAITREAEELVAILVASARTARKPA
jgi:hypothetical protein